MGITRPPEFSCLKAGHGHGPRRLAEPDRKSTRLNSSHSQISYAVFCLKKKESSVGSSGGDSAGAVGTAQPACIVGGDAAHADGIAGILGLVSLYRTALGCGILSYLSRR